MTKKGGSDERTSHVEALIIMTLVRNYILDGRAVVNIFFSLLLSCINGQRFVPGNSHTPSITPLLSIHLNLQTF